MDEEGGGSGWGLPRVVPGSPLAETAAVPRGRAGWPDVRRSPFADTKNSLAHWNSSGI
jgi:hypothetical protein